MMNNLLLLFRQMGKLYFEEGKTFLEVMQVGLGYASTKRFSCGLEAEV